MAVSHPDATPLISSNAVHHVRGRNHRHVGEDHSPHGGGATTGARTVKHDD